MTTAVSDEKDRFATANRVQWSREPVQRTTAAGTERVLVRDVRLEVAVALADRATPGLLTAFVQRADEKV